MADKFWGISMALTKRLCRKQFWRARIWDVIVNRKCIGSQQLAAVRGSILGW